MRPSETVMPTPSCPHRSLHRCLRLWLCLLVPAAACRADDPTTPAPASPPAPADPADDEPASVEAPKDDAAPSPEAMMADFQARGDAALARLREHAKAGVITAETIARIEQDRGRAGLGRFADVLEDALAIIEAGRVAPGTTIEINVHAGLGGDAPPLPPADEVSADVAFTDAASKRRVARICPIQGTLLSLDPFADRIRKLMQWWAQSADHHDVEIAIVPEPESPTFAAPEGAVRAYVLLEAGGLADRPLLRFPDGRHVTAKAWLGR